jgi:hypothetical protein
VCVCNVFAQVCTLKRTDTVVSCTAAAKGGQACVCLCHCTSTNMGVQVRERLCIQVCKTLLAGVATSCMLARACCVLRMIVCEILCVRNIASTDVTTSCMLARVRCQLPTPKSRTGVVRISLTCAFWHARHACSCDSHAQRQPGSTMRTSQNNDTCMLCVDTFHLSVDTCTGVCALTCGVFRLLSMHVRLGQAKRHRRAHMLQAWPGRTLVAPFANSSSAVAKPERPFECGPTRRF